jgi:hypothetical protein
MVDMKELQCWWHRGVKKGLMTMVVFVLRRLLNEVTAQSVALVRIGDGSDLVL